MKTLVKVFFLALTLVLPYVVFSQENRNYVDSTGKRQGFWEANRELYCKKLKQNDDCKIIVIGIEKGVYSDGKKVGLWTVVDDKGKLYKQELYDNDTLVIMIDYKRSKIRSITIVQYDKELSTEHQTWYKNIDVTSFSKCGIVKKREYKSVDNKTVKEKY